MKKQITGSILVTAAALASVALLCSTVHTLFDKIDNVTATSNPSRAEVVQVERTSPAETPEPVTVQETEPAEPETETDPRARDIELLGRTIWGEAGGVESTAERAAVAWCILNRVDAWDMTIEDVVTAPHQFYGYRTDGTCPQEHLDLAEDVLSRWESEKLGTCASGRTLPASYLYFVGDGDRNHFTKDWGSTDYWTWSLPNPY
jgi:hypothetical protein